ncbi:MAG: MBL fold metallo-hydrolase, partial [Melioribacteraceae bacterium]
LRTSLTNPVSIRFIKEELSEGKKYYQVEGMDGRRYMRYWFDEDTLLTKLEIMGSLNGYGDVLRNYFFKDNKKIKNLVIPSEVSFTITSSVFGEVITNYTITETTEDKEATGLLKVDLKDIAASNYSYRRNAEVATLAENLYMIENITSSTDFVTYNVLFAEFEDYTLVCEAPVSNEVSQIVIEKIKEVIPGKDIRYLVQSHHHNDHIGGIRDYIADGITIVTTSTNEQLFKKIVEAPFNFTPDKLSIAPVKLKTKLVENKKLLLKDKNQVAEIYDIGPTPHSNEMLITYFPKQGILYQSDMIHYGEWPLKNEATSLLVKKIKELNLNVNLIVGCHGKTINKTELDLLFSGNLVDPK